MKMCTFTQKQQWLEYGVDYLPPLSAKIKNACSFISIPSRHSMVLHMKVTLEGSMLPFGNIQIFNNLLLSGSLLLIIHMYVTYHNIFVLSLIL